MVEKLAVVMARLATELQDEPDEQTTVETIVARAVEMVGDATDASITLRVRGGRYTTHAATSDLARSGDRLQYELGEGPCLTSAAIAEWVRSGSVRDDARWPAWGPAAAELGLGSLLSVPLLARGESIGALNFYATAAGLFVSPDDVDLALLFAVHAAHALASARTVTELEVAVSSRHTIGMAQGILVERYGLTVNQAFDLLRRISSHSNTKLAEISRHIVATGSVPTVDEP